MKYDLSLASINDQLPTLGRTEVRTRERNDSRYDQFETCPETLEQELRPAVCEQRQTEIQI